MIRINRHIPCQFEEHKVRELAEHIEARGHLYYRVRGRQRGTPVSPTLVYQMRAYTPGPIERFAQLVSATCLGPYSNAPGHKPFWRCRIKGPKAYDVILSVWPYLSERKRSIFAKEMHEYEQKNLITMLHHPIALPASESKPEVPIEHTAKALLAGEAFIYVFENPTWPGAVKIGVSDSPYRRLNDLQVADPYRRFKMGFVQKFSQPYMIERAIHAALDEWRLQGEWFGCELEIAIEAIQIAADEVNES